MATKPLQALKAVERSLWRYRHGQQLLLHFGVRVWLAASRRLAHPPEEVPPLRHVVVANQPAPLL